MTQDARKTTDFTDDTDKDEKELRLRFDVTKGVGCKDVKSQELTPITFIFAITFLESLDRGT